MRCNRSMCAEKRRRQDRGERSGGGCGADAVAGSVPSFRAAWRTRSIKARGSMPSADAAKFKTRRWLSAGMAT